LKLPKEIRHIIYEFWIEPLRSPDENGSIKVEISVMHEYHNNECHPFRDGYKMSVPVLIKSQAIIDVMDRLDRLADHSDNESHNENGDELEEQEAEQSAEISEEHFDNPLEQVSIEEFESERENQQSNEPSDFLDPEHGHRTWENYTTLRSLSQVSQLLRTELGVLFWKNISLDIGYYETLLLDFLHDRPSVALGIKKLHTSWTANHDALGIDSDLSEFSYYVSQHLVLDELKFDLHCSPKTARTIIASGDELDWVEAFRQINVKVLKFGLFLNYGEEHDEYRALYQRLERRLGPLVEEVLRPVTAGHVEAEVDKQ